MSYFLMSKLRMWKCQTALECRLSFSFVSEAPHEIKRLQIKAGGQQVT